MLKSSNAKTRDQRFSSFVRRHPVASTPRPRVPWKWARPYGLFLLSDSKPIHMDCVCISPLTLCLLSSPQTPLV